MRAVGVRIPGVRRVGVDGVDDSPRLAALRDAVSLFEATKGEGEEGPESGCDIKEVECERDEIPFLMDRRWDRFSYGF